MKRNENEIRYYLENPELDWVDSSEWYFDLEVATSEAFRKATEYGRPIEIYQRVRTVMDPKASYIDHPTRDDLPQGADESAVAGSDR